MTAAQAAGEEEGAGQSVVSPPVILLRAFTRLSIKDYCKENANPEGALCRNSKSEM